MDHDEQLKKIIADLKTVAYKYQSLLGLTIVFRSKDFIHRKTYKARFNKENFLHLTGIQTKLKAIDFFEKCCLGTIAEADLLNFPEEYDSKIFIKLRNLKHIDTYFSQELMFQEDFKKNVVSCLVASSDGFKTLGFVSTGVILLPMTLLNRNQLDPNKPIIKVFPKIIDII
jgi:hypothetical protein